MKRTLATIVAASIVAGLTGTAAPARTLDLAFMPPHIETRNICSADPEETAFDVVEEGTAKELTDHTRIRYMRRDIIRLQAQDADKWFDFINALITRLAGIDERFAGVEEMIARITLHIDAGRAEELKAKELVPQLRQRELEMTSNQRLTLAQYYLNGIGVEKNEVYAKKLITDAAYNGNPNALLSIARFALTDNPVEGWDAPLELTVTMAFGGLLGRMNETVCNRAIRIAREYLSGDVVSRNDDVANAWFKFAAELGSAEAAWRIVEYHLNADADKKDNKEMLQYLKMAVVGGMTVDDTELARIKSAGQVDEEELRAILGYNYSEDTGRERASLSKYFELAVNIDGEKSDEESMYLKYLRELAAMPEAPGWIFTELATEVLTRRGRWAGEQEAREMLEIAAQRQDPEGMQLLAKILVRYRDDPAQANRAADLLTQVVERHGMMEAMSDLAGLYRCKLNDSPRLSEAHVRDRAYRASEYDALEISATDLLVLSAYKEPRHAAMVQSQALDGRPQSMADFAERIQADRLSTESMKRLWADQLDRSDQALEQFAELEIELATNPAEQDLAIELFRRVYLNNGVTTALDLAIALTEYNARDQQTADEIISLLTRAANRGEGAAIRLMARLQAREGRSPADVYAQFATEIEERGDFLALMFAVPYLTQYQLDDYIDRAVSEMVCGTKDIEEVADAYAIWQDAQMSYHWKTIGLTFDYGHTLSKLRLSDPQMDQWRRGRAISESEAYARLLSEGDTSAHRELYRLTSDPDLETYDPQAAAEHLFALASRRGGGDEAWVLTSFRKADADVQQAIRARFDINAVYQAAIDNGSVDAKYEYAMSLRANASQPNDLNNSARWLKEAAEAGNIDAMTEYGYALAYGIGIPRNVREALSWFDQAASGGSERAQSLAGLIRISAGQ